MLLFKKYRSVVSNKNLLCCVFIKLVCMFVVSINTVFGDVVKSNLTNNINNDKPTHNLNGTQNITKNSFANIVQTHRNNNNGQLIDFPEENLFVGNMWQMPGCCALFSGDSLQQLYYAKKRGYGNGNNIPDNLINLFNYSNYMHTERQLAIVSMYDKLCNGGGLKEANNLQEFINRSLIVHDGLQQPIIDGNVQVTIHTYTHANPCQNTVPDNCYMSCVDYFNRLANSYPNINFCVYFYSDGMRLNPAFISKNKLQNKLLCFVRDRLSKNEERQLSFLDKKNNAWCFVLSEDKSILKIYKSGKDLGDKCDFEFVIGKFNNGKSGDAFKDLLTVINDILAVNNGKQNYSIITNEDRTELFNSVHNPNNIPNIHYYPI